jgi:hypothetical protein
MLTACVVCLTALIVAPVPVTRIDYDAGWARLAPLEEAPFAAGDLGDGTYRSLLASIVAKAPTKGLALVPPDLRGSQVQPPVPCTGNDVLDWLWLTDRTFEPWYDGPGRFVALRPLPRGPVWSPRVMAAWGGEDDVCGHAVQQLVGRLSPTENARIAAGQPLQPALMSAEAQQAAIALLAREEDRAAVAETVGDPNARLWVWLDPQVRLQLHDAPERAHSSAVSYIRGDRPEPRLTAMPNADELDGIVARYEAYRAEHPEAPAEDLGVLSDRAVTMGQGPHTVASVTAQLADALGCTVSGLEAYADWELLATPGEWRTAEIADALSAVTVTRLRVTATEARFEAPTMLVPTALAAQMVLADGWSTSVFTPDDLAFEEPRPLAELTEEQRAALLKVFAAKLTGDATTTARVSLVPRVQVFLDAWVPVASVGGPAEAPPPVLAATFELLVDGLWQRMPQIGAEGE